ARRLLLFNRSFKSRDSFFHEYLLGLVIRPSSAACAVAGPMQIASESARLAEARFLKLIRIPDMLLVSPDRTPSPALGVKALYTIGSTTRRARQSNSGRPPIDTSKRARLLV